jgi:hypothetical protein
MKVLTVVITGCVLVGAACSSSSKHTASTPTTSTANPLTPDAQARHEVAIASCGPNAKHDVEIKGTAHNARAGTALYTVQLDISDKSGKKLFQTAAAATVAPGKTEPWDAATSAKYATGMTCAVDSVSRHVTS